MKEKVSKFTYPMFPHYFIVLHITNTHSMRKIINQRGITCEKPSHQNFRQICTSTLLSLTTKKKTKFKIAYIHRKIIESKFPVDMLF